VSHSTTIVETASLNKFRKNAGFIMAIFTNIGADNTVTFRNIRVSRVRRHTPRFLT
jgi:hypothetical protein